MANFSKPVVIASAASGLVVAAMVAGVIGAGSGIPCLQGNVCNLQGLNVSGDGGFNGSVLAAGSNTPRFLADRFSDVLNVLDYGAKGNCQQLSDGAIAATTKTLTSASNPFKKSSEGMTVIIDQAGAVGAFNNLPLVATIATYVSPGQVTLSAAATNTVTGAVFTFGSDNGTAIASAVTAMPTKGGRLYFPKGSYCIPYHSSLVALSGRTDIIVSGDEDGTTFQFPPDQRLSGAVTYGVNITGNSARISVEHIKFEGTLLSFGTEAQQVGINYAGANGNTAQDFDFSYDTFENMGNLPIEVSTAGSTAVIQRVSTHDCSFDGDRGGIAYSGVTQSIVANNRFTSGCEADDDVDLSRNTINAVVANNVHQRGNTCTTAQGRAIVVDGSTGGEFINVNVSHNVVYCTTRDNSQDPTVHLPAIDADLRQAGTTANIEIVGNQLEACEQPIVARGSGTTGSVTIAENQIDGVLNTDGGIAGILVYSITGALIQNNRISGIQPKMDGIHVGKFQDAGISQNVVILGNEILGAGGDGIYLDNVTLADVTGNTISQSANDNVALDGGVISFHLGGGINTGATGYGINLLGATSPQIDLDGLYSSNTSGNINDAATSTTINDMVSHGTQTLFGDKTWPGDAGFGKNVTIGGLVGSYDGVSTAGLGLPSISASNHVSTSTHLTSVASVTAPNAVTVYEVGGFLQVTSLSVGSVGMVITYTDQHSGAQNQDLLAGLNPAAGLTVTTLAGTGIIQYYSSTIVVKANTSVTLQAYISNTATGDFYGWIQRVN